MQLHGGMGVTQEMSIGQYLKRLVSIANVFGSAEFYLKSTQKAKLVKRFNPDKRRRPKVDDF